MKKMPHEPPHAEEVFWAHTYMFYEMYTICIVMKFCLENHGNLKRGGMKLLTFLGHVVLHVDVEVKKELKSIKLLFLCPILPV